MLAAPQSVGIHDAFVRCVLFSLSPNLEKAVDYLRQKGLAAAAKRADRVAADGAVGAYVHPGGKIGVLVEINCQTDFVARTTNPATGTPASIRNSAKAIFGCSPTTGNIRSTYARA